MKNIYIITSEAGLRPLAFSSLKKAVEMIIDVYMTQHDKGIKENPKEAVKEMVLETGSFSSTDHSSLRYMLTHVKNEEFNPSVKPKNIF